MATKTRWTLSEAVAVGNALVAAAASNATRLTARGYGAAARAALSDAVAAATGAAAGQPVRTGTQKSATAALGDTLARVQASVSAVHAAIRRRWGSRADIQRAFGVGNGHAATLGAGLSAIDAALAGQSAYAAEAAAAFVTAGDLANLRTLRAALLAADTAQEGAKGARKTGTAAKDALLRALVAEIDKLLAAAHLEFAHEPEILAQFLGPLPTRGRKKAAPASGAAA